MPSGARWTTRISGRVSRPAPPPLPDVVSLDLPVPGKRERQRAIRELVARQQVTSQEELAEELRRRGFAVTQATVSRDIHELGLVKMTRGDRHVYISPADFGPPLPPPAVAAPPAANPSDERLARLVRDIPVQVGRSGLTLLLIGA